MLGLSFTEGSLCRRADKVSRAAFPDNEPPAPRALAIAVAGTASVHVLSSDTVVAAVPESNENRNEILLYHLKINGTYVIQPHEQSGPGKMEIFMKIPLL